MFSGAARNHIPQQQYVEHRGGHLERKDQQQQHDVHRYSSAALMVIERISLNSGDCRNFECCSREQMYAGERPALPQTQGAVQLHQLPQLL